MRRLIIPFLLCIFGALFYSYEFVLRLLPGFFSEKLIDKYAINAMQLGLLSIFYYYAYIFMQIPVGALFDRFKPFPLIILAATACMAGSILFACSDSIWIARTGRLLMGFGSAFAFVGALKISATALPSRLFPIASGIIGTFGMISVIGGQLLMGHLAKIFSWEYAIIIFGSIALPFIVISLLLHFYYHQSYNINIKPATFVEIFQVFYTLIRKSWVWITGITGALMFLPISIFVVLWGNPYLSQAYGLQNNEIEIINSSILLGVALGGPFIGWISEITNNRKYIIFTCALTIAIIPTIIFYIHTPTGIISCFLAFIVGIATSSVMLLFVIAKEQVLSKFSAISISIINMLVISGGMLLQPIAGYILDLHGPIQSIVNGKTYFSTHAYHMALIIIPLGGLIAAALSLKLPAKKF